MKIQTNNWLRKFAFPALIAMMVSSCAEASTDFNQVGKQMSILLQNNHFSRTEFSEDLSNKFLDTYLMKMDPS
ncbi:MAG: hypothetical protein RSB48_07265, partial [Akkermansia sp.]